MGIQPNKQAPPGSLGVESQNVPGNYSEFAYNTNYIANERFHIDNIRMRLRDLARPNMFVCRCIMPDGNEDPFVTDLVKTATFPSIEIGKIQISRQNNEINYPGDSKYGECSVTFYNDENCSIRSFFHAWQLYFVHNYSAGITGLYSLAKKGRVIIEQLDANYKVTYACELQDAWPNTIGEIQVSHDTENSREEFTVNFSYLRFTTWRNNNG